MKRNLLYLFSMLCVLSFFTACSDDDDVKSLGNELDGVFKGALSVNLNGTAIPGDIPQKVYITKVGENQVKMELKNFSFGPMSLGDISVDECAVVNKGDIWELTGDQSLTLPAPIGKCEVKLTGNIAADNIEMVINVDAGAAGIVEVTFKGKKLAADQSSEAKITEFTFDSDLVLSQPAIEGNNITFVVSDKTTNEQLATLVPTIKISAGATITPESGKAQDFSKAVTYTVVSEDGITSKTYTVSIGTSSFFDFETWVKGVEDQEPAMTFYEVANGWSSSNTGAHFLKAFGMTDSYVVTQSSDAHSGKSAAEIKTIDTQGQDMVFVKVPKVTTGTLFQGRFITDISNTLASTKFGNEYKKKPLALKGYYKYTPGKDFYRCESVATCHIATIDANSTDSCAINAILYEVNDFDDENEYLTGENVYTNTQQIVAIAQLADGSKKENWTSFELKLNYVKDYNPTKKYRFAIICSSSKDGDKFNGAPGSTLLVDDFEVIAE